MLVASASARDLQDLGKDWAPWLATIACLRFASDLYGPKTTTQAFKTGAEGEERVGIALDRLERRGCIVAHDLALPMGGNIDHVVIASGGIFTVETKNSAGTAQLARGRLIVAGCTRQEHLDQATRQAEFVRRQLATDTMFEDVAVHPTLVYARASVKLGIFGGRSIRGVAVGTPSYVLSRIRTSRGSLTHEQIARLRLILGV